MRICNFISSDNERYKAFGQPFFDSARIYVNDLVLDSFTGVLNHAQVNVTPALLAVPEMLPVVVCSVTFVLS